MSDLGSAAGGLMRIGLFILCYIDGLQHDKADIPA